MSEFWGKGIITSNKEQKKKYSTISPIAKEKDDDECDNNNFRICRSYSVECSFLPRNFVPTIKPKQSIKQINPLQLTNGIIHEKNNMSEDESENKRKKRPNCTRKDRMIRNVLPKITRCSPFFPFSRNNTLSHSKLCMNKRHP